VATERKVELHCHCDGVVDPAMLRDFARRGEDLEATGKELEAAYPVTSLQRWVATHEAALSENSLRAGFGAQRTSGV
jgi:hypothetical protein